MSVPEFYEALFRWPHPEAKDVIVTGEFDAWACSTHLPRTATGFEGTVQVPWGRKIAYKYIVDGRWSTTDDQPTEIDSIGNLNNVLSSPARPSLPKAPTLSSPAPPSKPVGQTNGVLAAAKNAAVAVVETVAPGTIQTSEKAPDAAQDESSPAPTEPAKEGTIASANGNADTKPKEEKIAEVTPAVADTPAQEVAVEAVLPSTAEVVAPVVPVPVLPQAATEEAPIAKGGIQPPLETVVVEGSATAEPAAPAAPAVIASTHTPVLNGDSVTAVKPEPEATSPPVGASTHTPIATTETETVSSVNGTKSPSSTTSEPSVAPVNGTNGTHPPPPTPASAPLASANGKFSDAPSSPISPTAPASPLKEKRHAFPTFGRHHRSSSSSVSVSTGGGADERSSLHLSQKGSQREKRRTSFFGKIKEMFSDDHHQKQKK